MTERDLKRGIIDAIKLAAPKARVVRLFSGAIRTANGSYVQAGEPGVPDLLVLLTLGRVVWIETKTAEGRVSAAQQRWHKAARALGHTVIVARDIETALQAVRT
jgi:hypothetical protein